MKPKRATAWRLVLALCALWYCGNALGQTPATPQSNAGTQPGEVVKTKKKKARAAAGEAPSPSEKNAGAAAAAKPTPSEIQAAKADGKVWVNTSSGVYHKGGKWYGATKQGKFMSEQEAINSGFRAAKNDGKP
jgi:hypothetical protein